MDGCKWQGQDTKRAISPRSDDLNEYTYLLLVQVDFGFAKIVRSQTYTLCGTPEWDHASYDCLRNMRCETQDEYKRWTKRGQEHDGFVFPCAKTIAHALLSFSLSSRISGCDRYCLFNLHSVLCLLFLPTNLVAPSLSSFLAPQSSSWLYTNRIGNRSYKVCPSRSSASRTSL